MFLMDLKNKLDEIQVSHGNVPLDYVHIVHGTTLAIQHGFEPDVEYHETESRPKLVSIAEAEGIAGTLEERLEAAGPTGIVSLTGEELQQLLEFKAEAMAPATSAPAQLGKVMEEAAAKLPAELCDMVDVIQGPCTLAFNHEGPHVWAHPYARADKEALEVERELKQEQPAQA